MDAVNLISNSAIGTLYGVDEELKRYEPKRWQDTMKTRKDVAEVGANAPEPPKETFSRTPHVIEDPTRRVEFHFFGWAHTRGDGFVYLPKDKLLCTGDAAVNGPYNFVGDGNIGNWPNVIAKAQKLAVEHVLPGHGPSGGKEILANQKLFFVELRARVAAAIKQGKKSEEIAKAIQMPDAAKNYVGPDFAGQVLAAYNEITQKKASGDLPH